MPMHAEQRISLLSFFLKFLLSVTKWFKCLKGYKLKWDTVVIKCSLNMSPNCGGIVNCAESFLRSWHLLKQSRNCWTFSGVQRFITVCQVWSPVLYFVTCWLLQWGGVSPPS
jgi:hypothetical protein